LVGNAAVPALEALAESMRACRGAGVIHFNSKRRTFAFVERRLDRIDQTRPDVVAGLDAVYDDRERRSVAKRSISGCRVLDWYRTAVNHQAPESATPK